MRACACDAAAENADDLASQLDDENRVDLWEELKYEVASIGHELEDEVEDAQGNIIAPADMGADEAAAGVGAPLPLLHAAMIADHVEQPQQRPHAIAHDMWRLQDAQDDLHVAPERPFRPLERCAMQLYLLFAMRYKYGLSIEVVKTIWDVFSIGEVRPPFRRVMKLLVTKYAPPTRFRRIQSCREHVLFFDSSYNDIFLPHPNPAQEPRIPYRFSAALTCPVCDGARSKSNPRFCVS